MDVCIIPIFALSKEVVRHTNGANAFSDKKSATTYQLFHRSQNDPLIHDPEAEDRVLHQVSGPAPAPASSSKKKAVALHDLEEEFEGSGARKNEGEAANYGVFFDDSNYDYMQHMRDLGQGGGNAYFVEAATGKGKGKNKGLKLEDALRETTLNDDNVDGSTYGDDLGSMASTYSRKPTYQDQQNIPDSIAGFKPDMDPRLREALEALDDDAFVDDGGDEDAFDSLVEGGLDAEVDPDEWRDTYIEDEDGGWESDATEKAPVQHGSSSVKGSEISANAQNPSKMPPQDAEIPDVADNDGDWMRNFAKYKKDTKSKAPAAQEENPSEFRTAASTMFTVGGTPIRKKKRKGALTNPSAYSMTSSSIARTDGLRLLDDRFERVEALYALDEEGEDFDGSMADDASMASGVSRFSEAPSLVSQSGDVPLRSDFDGIMDGFLAGWQDRGVHTKRKGAKAKRGKNGNEVVGMRMLDEVREGLGPAKFHGKA